MKDEPDKFICLADYWCRCEPVGKPVNESTMVRHRRICNQARRIHGLAPLGRGPRHSFAREIEEYERRLSLDESSNPSSERFAGALQELEVQGGNDQNIIEVPIDLYHDDSDYEGCDKLSEQVASVLDVTFQVGAGHNDVDVTTEAVVDVGLDEGRLCHDEPVTAQRQEPSDSEGAHDGSFEDEVLESVGLIDSENGDAEEFAQDEVEFNLSDEIGSGFRPEAMARFWGWASEARGWIKLFVDYAITLAVMNRILKLLSAPYVAITLRRNLRRYCGLETVRYKTCRGHMLIGKELSTGEIDSRSCDICEENGSQPDFCTLEYIPVLPRLRAWVGNKDSYNHLFSYYRAKLSERMNNGNDFAPGEYFEDVQDGRLFRGTADRLGGFESVMNDVWIAPSCDGFQTFANKSYDCWPVVAIVHNLPPHMRFLMKNIVPLMFIHGPREPIWLDTFFSPLLEELSASEASDGHELRYYNGDVGKSRIHVSIATGDGPAVAKITGTSGANGKACCRVCDVHGFFCSISGHYYVVSKVLLPSPNGRRPVTKHFYDVYNPPVRNADSIRATANTVSSGLLARRAAAELGRDSGIKNRTLLYDFPSLVPFASFPLDTMHLFMNLSKDLMELLKGENPKLIARGYKSDDFVISDAGWTRIDAEMLTLGKGTAACAFGTVPRPSDKYRQWKAVECRDFFVNFALVMFEGYLPSVYLNGLSLFCRALELCLRPTLTKDDLNDLDNAAKGFVVHFEKYYYRYKPDRACLCKSTIHALTHLAYTVEQCGPLVNCNQYWVERYVGDVKRKLSATHLAAESLTEDAKFSESYKMFYDEHFKEMESSDEDDSSAADRDGVSDGDVRALPPFDLESLDDDFHRRHQTRRLLVDYLVGCEGISRHEATQAVSDNAIYCFGRLQIGRGVNSQRVGALHARRHRRKMKRGDHYVSAEFLDSADPSARLVYYGRLSKVLKYTFRTESWHASRVLVLVQWADRLQCNSRRQIFRCSSISSSFKAATVEQASVIRHSIGVVEHKVPHVRGTKTYFIDPNREAGALLDGAKLGADGILRSLGGTL